MEAVYSMVELVLGYGGALFRIAPEYLVHAAERTRGNIKAFRILCSRKRMSCTI